MLWSAALIKIWQIAEQSNFYYLTYNRNPFRPTTKTYADTIYTPTPYQTIRYRHSKRRYKMANIDTVCRINDIYFGVYKPTTKPLTGNEAKALTPTHRANVWRPQFVWDYSGDKAKLVKINPLLLHSPQQS